MQSPNHIEGQRSPAVGHLMDAATTTNEGNKIARLKSPNSDGTRRRPPAPIENGNEHAAPFPAQRESFPARYENSLFHRLGKLSWKSVNTAKLHRLISALEQTLRIPCKFPCYRGNSRMCSSITASGKLLFSGHPRPDGAIAA